MLFGKDNGFLLLSGGEDGLFPPSWSSLMASQWKKISLSSWVGMLSDSLEADHLGMSLSSSTAVGLLVRMTCLVGPLGLPMVVLGLVWPGSSMSCEY